MSRIIYLDNAASSWPKPPAVMEAMNRCLLEFAANPGRGSHRMAIAASKVLFETRKNLSRLFHVSNPMDINFSANTTMALNQAILGYLKPGDHVISTTLEHNSVRRPLEYLAKTRQVEITYISADEKGHLCLDELNNAVCAYTKLIVCSHANNLLGTIQPLDKIGEIARKHGIKLLVDAAQTAGTIEIDVRKLEIDMLAFPGHKALLGPQGTGGLYVDPNLELEPLLHGGTGSQSEHAEQPNVRPDRFEAGTQNTVGIAGLNEGVKFVLHETLEKIHNKEWNLTQRMMEGLVKINGIRVLGPDLGEDKAGIVAFQFDRISASEAAFQFDKQYGIAVRAGHHCTPLTHSRIGTLENGAVRASVGYFTTEDEIDQLIASAKQIAGEAT